MGLSAIFIVAKTLVWWSGVTTLISWACETTRISSSLSSNSHWLTDNFFPDPQPRFAFLWRGFFPAAHFEPKWFSFLQLLQTLPNAGHFALAFSWLWPQYWHSHITGGLSGCFGVLVTLFTSGGGGACEVCPVMASNWVEVASALLQISRHLSRVSSGTWSNFFLMLLSRTPQTILSRINSSFNAPKLQCRPTIAKWMRRFPQFCLLVGSCCWTRNVCRLRLFSQGSTTPITRWFSPYSSFLRGLGKEGHCGSTALSARCK